MTRACAVGGVLVLGFGLLAAPAGAAKKAAGPLTVSVKSAAFAEPNGGPARQFTVTLSAPAPEQIHLRWRTVDGTAMSGEDYAGRTDEAATIFKGKRTTNNKLPVLVFSDTKVEPNETFKIQIFEATLLSSGTPVAIGPDGVVTIRNNDR